MFPRIRLVEIYPLVHCLISHCRSFSPPLSANLLLPVILSPLSITDVPSRHRDIHAACLQRGHKEPCLHQYSHISPLYCATNHTLAAREASDRGCVTVLVANSPELSGSKELFNFPVYLRRQQCNNKLLTEICTVCVCVRVYVPSCMHARMSVHCGSAN